MFDLKKIWWSFFGMFLWLILFLASFVVLFVNEGRDDLSKVAVNAIETDSAQINEELDKQFVAAYGILKSSQSLEHNILDAGDKYLAINERIEQFTIKTYEIENEDGSKETKTDRTRESKDTKIKKQMNVKFGEYHVAMEKVDLPSFAKLELNQETLKKEYWSGNYDEYYLYVNTGAISNPLSGDIRTSFTVLNNNIEWTILAQTQSNKLVTFYDEKWNRFYRLFLGTKGEAIQALHKEYKSAKRGMRILWFAMMWIGLMMIMGLVTTLVGFIPILWGITKWLISGITLVLSLLLSWLVIRIGMIAHNWIALIVMIIVVGWLTTLLMLKGKKKIWTVKEKVKAKINENIKKPVKDAIDKKKS